MTTKTIEPCLGIPVRYDEKHRSIVDSRGVWRWKEIVVGPDFFRFPPAEQAALLLHEAGHVKLQHLEKRLLCLFTPWRIPALCRAQEFEADAFVRSIGYARQLAGAFSRLQSTPSPLYPPLSERLQRLI